jgi:hypothetical protein
MHASFRSGLDAARYCSALVFVLVLGFALACSLLEEKVPIADP